MQFCSVKSFHQTCVDEIPFWVHCPENSIPDDALKGGQIGDEILYIGRAIHNRALTPAICREEIPYWILFDGEIPKQAIKGGSEDGKKLYIGRAAHNGSLTPGKISEADHTCIIPWGTVANVKVADFQILMCGSDTSWVAAENGQVPSNAFVAGYSEQGESLFIGRVRNSRGDLIIGKVQPSHRVCYIAQQHQEVNFRQYEVFVV